MDAREREKGRLISEEYEENEKKKASPDFVAKMRKQFLDSRNRGEDAPLEDGNGTVAPNS